MRLQIWLWGLLVVGLLCQVHGHTEDDEDFVEDDIVKDEAMEDEESEEHTLPIDSEEPKERPKYETPVPKGNAFFTETFDNAVMGDRWIISQAKKEDTDENISKYNGEWAIDEPEDNPLQGDRGLVLSSRAKHHAISSLLDRPFEFQDKPFIMQYEVKFQNGQECGGAYVKLITDTGKFDQNKFQDKTGYTIMFGPDKCGNDNKLHFIFRHKNPITGKFEEKHAKKPTAEIGSYFSDKKTHVWTLVIQPDNTFEIFVDLVLVNSGSLLEDFQPAVNPAKEITDPKDKKPADWDEREKIPDPTATKPEDWDEDAPENIEDPDATKPDGWLDDEPDLVHDPEAEKPTDWDDDMDGEWEAPQINNPKCEAAPGCGEWKRPTIKNPAYKGKWKASMIDNPSYKGKWSPRKIANPDYFDDLDPFSTMTAISAIGLELWSMSDGIYFDNFIITDDKTVADQWAADSWEIKSSQETAGGLSGKSVVQAVMDATKERPWLWAVFIIVVVLPIVLVVAYCCMSGTPKVSSLFQRLIDAADERKWLYAVYVVVVLLPVAILSVYCCPGKLPGAKKDDAARQKKTDESQPDDVEEEEEEQAEEVGSGDAKTSPKPKKGEKKKPSKSALEAEEADEADAEDDEADKPAEKATPPRSSPRKRKAKPLKE